MSTLPVSSSPRRPPRAARSLTLESVRSFTSSNGSTIGNSGLLEGYYGHLTLKQERALEDLRSLLQEDGILVADDVQGEARGSRTSGVSDLELL